MKKNSLANLPNISIIRSVPTNNNTGLIYVIFHVLICEDGNDATAQKAQKKVFIL